MIELNLPVGDAPLPRDVRSFLREADRRIRRFRSRSRLFCFVPSDFERTYGVLRALAEANLAPGNLFCEWGSGFGVVACLAAMLDFDACGIEIEPELVDAARQLAEDFSLPVEFVCDSFIPKGGKVHAATGDTFSWLTTVEGDTSQELGLVTDDFDIVYAYPWPDEEEVTGDLFERYGREGAVLVTYHGGENFRVRRKTGHRGRKAR